MCGKKEKGAECGQRSAFLVSSVDVFCLLLSFCRLFYLAEQQARRDDQYTSFTIKPTPTAGDGLQENLKAPDATALNNSIRVACSTKSYRVR